MRLLIIFLSLLSFAACSKKPVETINPEPPVEDSIYVWRQLIYPNGIDSNKINRGGFGPFVKDGQLITTLLPLASKNVETLGLFDVEKRTFLWKWNDYFPDARQDLDGGWSFPNTTYAFSGNEQYYLSLETGETLLRYRINTNEKIEGGCSVIGDKIIHVRQKGYEMAFYMSTKMTEEWEPIFTLEKDPEGYDRSLELPVIDINSKGDTILFFQDRRWRQEYPWYKIDFYAYNLTQKEVVWKNEGISTIVSKKDKPLIDATNNRIFFGTRYTMFCFDMETGEELWHNELDYAGLLSSDYIYHDGKVITVTDQGYLIAFDGDTGQRLYYERKGGCCVSGLVVHKDKIYHVDTELYISDLNTGKSISELAVFGGFNGQPIFDDDTGLMYITDRYYMYAMKIPE